MNATTHHVPTDFSDRLAFGLVKAMRLFADAFFTRGYGHAAAPEVPAPHGPDHGWIHTLLDEAEIERMHLMTFIEIAKPNLIERLLVLLVQVRSSMPSSCFTCSLLGRLIASSGISRKRR
jgi:ubiquinol oxidase